MLNLKHTMKYFGAQLLMLRLLFQMKTGKMHFQKLDAPYYFNRNGITFRIGAFFNIGLYFIPLTAIE